MRVSYNDYKLYLSILESVSKQLNKAIKSEASSNFTDEVPHHDFDGKENIDYRVLLFNKLARYPYLVRKPLLAVTDILRYT